MKKAIDLYLTVLATDVIQEQRRLGIRASGQSAKSLNIKFAGNDIKGEGQLRGSDYFEYQFYGRGPTRNGGGGYLRKRIREWLNTKTFAAGMTAKEKEGLSYGITKKIHERGTLRGRSSRFPGIDFKGLVNKHRPKLIRDLGKETAARMESDIIRAYKS